MNDYPLLPARLGYLVRLNRCFVSKQSDRHTSVVYSSTGTTERAVIQSVNVRQIAGLPEERRGKNRIDALTKINILTNGTDSEATSTKPDV